jgi:indolepyruvate ferredoxin oxidoreductase
VPSAAQEHLVRESGTTLPLTGVQALARLPVELMRAERHAGRRTAGFICGYEGSPLGGYDLELGRHQGLLDEYDIVFRPGVNEELAATAVQGSQLATASQDRTVDGVIGFWYGKSPGLDRAADALRHANLMGVPPGGGALALVGDDPAAKSSTVPCASERLLADLGMPTLYPADPQDVLDLGMHAAAMSRATGLWVALKIVTSVADGTGIVSLGRGRWTSTGLHRGVEHEVTAKMTQPTLGVLERSRDGARLDAALEYARRNRLDSIARSGSDDRLGIAAAGATYLEMRHALELLGFDDAELSRRGIRLLRLALINPVSPWVVAEFAAGLQEILVVEEKRPFLETAFREVLYGKPDAPRITGKKHPDGRPLIPADGELTAGRIAAALAARLTDIGGFPTAESWAAAQRRDPVQLPLIPRLPYFCSGCPHNRSTKAPEGSLVGGGIGCHGLVTMISSDTVGTVTGLSQMGGEGAQWIGMEPFVRHDHLLQNIGDGTFHHSGSLAVRASVAAGSHITFKLLYNSAVAMTGGQQPTGMLTVPELTRSLLAEGVKRVIITTEAPDRYRRVRLPRGVRVWHRDRIDEAQRVLAGTAGVTVLIHDQECATELRRKRKRGLAPDPAQRVMINERVCEGCGDCGVASNCLSVQPVDTEFGRKTRIDQSSCNKDFSCLAGDCPSFLTVVPGRKPAQQASAPMLGEDALPEPVLPVATTHATRITGIGGTGVVTLSQILTTAATLAGRFVRALDQTGLAQKGGAVVSDVVVSDSPAHPAGRIGPGECDLYLCCDLLVGADEANLAVADPGRTTAVISVSRVPTGRMVVDPGVSYPLLADVVDRIAPRTMAKPVTVDARDLSRTLLGHDQYANMLLAGAAYQAGALPIPSQYIEEAIRQGGVQVERNIEAFRRGRQAVAAPQELAAVVAGRRGAPPAERWPMAAAELLAGLRIAEDGELAKVLRVRVPDLIEYQDLAYAKKYVEVVDRVRRAEDELAEAGSRLAVAVARNLYKLMAYKDEYEVARLSTAPEVARAVRAEFGPDAKVSYQLHPPVLRAAGMRGKIALGSWFRPAFRLLVAMRRVRGTPFDPFGRSTVRRLERALVSEYLEVVDTLCAGLTHGTHDAAVEIASLPDMVRGYEEIKIKNVERYRKALGQRMARFSEVPVG